MFRIRVKDIVINKARIMRANLDSRELRESIKADGYVSNVLHPIKVERDGSLVCGFLRVKALMDLGMGELLIEVEVV